MYNFYKNTYGGELTEEQFSKLYPRVKIILNNMTCGKLNRMIEQKGTTEEISYTLCEGVDAFNRLQSRVQSGESGYKTSESVGPHSVSYSEKSIPSSFEDELLGIAERYLGNTNLLCRWVF